MSSWVNKTDSNLLEDSSSSISLPITQLHGPPINMVCVQVIRSWDLPETLTDTNPYVIIDWGKLGISKTQTIQNTTEPVFNATLRFRFPFNFDCNYDAITNLKMKAHKLPSLKISIYSKNFSISDELLGESDLNAEYFINLTLSNPNDSKVAGGTIPIYDNHKSVSQNKITGYIELKTFSFT
jgi:Ca2+-dependent lipid-binding protein